METSYIGKKTGKPRVSIQLLAALLFVFIAVAGTLNQAMAQRNNASDWQVPPPLPPGDLTKGNTTGKGPAGKPVVLTLTDIPAVPLPDASPVQLPLLAAVSTTPPVVKTPELPIIPGIDAGLPEIPAPGTPDATPLPKQSVQDVQIPTAANLPLPSAPELPAFPAEPTPSGQNDNVKNPLPLMPDVASQPTPTLGMGTSFAIWATPGIPENIDFKFVQPTGEKGAGHGSKGAQKVKPRSLKN